MKKISIIFLSLLTLITITGCGSTEEKEDPKEEQKEEQKEDVKEQKLVCTSTESEYGINFEEVITMTYKNDKLKYLTSEVNTKVTNPTFQESWEAFKENIAEKNQEYSKEGIDFKIYINDQNYEYKTMINVDIEKASEEDLENVFLDGIKEDTSTIEDNQKAAEAEGYICEIR